MYVYTKLYFIMIIADNGLSFIETSALDATNVDQSFQQILTGKNLVPLFLFLSFIYSFFLNRNLPYCFQQGFGIIQQYNQAH